MIDLSTVKELRALRLPGMARELESQLEDLLLFNIIGQTRKWESAVSFP